MRPKSGKFSPEEMLLNRPTILSPAGRISINCSRCGGGAKAANWLKLIRSGGVGVWIFQKRASRGQKPFCSRCFRLTLMRCEIKFYRVDISVLRLSEWLLHARPWERWFLNFSSVAGRGGCAQLNQKGTAKRMGPRGAWSVFLTASLLIRHAAGRIILLQRRKEAKRPSEKNLYSFTTGCISSALY